jgi:hypothetical protein
MKARQLSVTAVLALCAGAFVGLDAQSGQGTTVPIPAAQPQNPDATKAIPGFIGNPLAPPPMQIPAGFTPIFNGVNLDGWHMSKTNHHGITPDYHVMHGMIVGTQDPFGSGGILLTDKSYKNVEVYMEVKPDWGCDSGLFLRTDEAGNAYQVTLDYLAGGSLGNMYGEGLQGVTNANAPAPAAGRGNAAAAGRGRQGGAAPAQPPPGGIPLGMTTPVGDAAWTKVWKREDWNSIRARIEGTAPHVTVWINGTQVLDFQDTGNHASGGITEGPIAIQIHGGNRWVPGGFWRWRVIAVRELPD